MSVKVIKDHNRLPNLIAIMEELNRTELHVGIFGKDDSHLLIIANVNEFGCVIKPKKAKRLAIPLNKRARERSPRSFSDLWVLSTGEGANKKLWLVRNKGSNQIEFMYWLAKEVVIPERAFLRGGFDANHNQFSEKAVRLLGKVIKGRLSMDHFFEKMGDYIVGELQGYMLNLQDPPNSFATKSAKGKSNPLVDSGRLLKAITYKIIKK